MIFTQDILDRLTDRDAAAVVDTAVVHHTAGNDQMQDIAEIAQEEINAFGFSTVGYHAVIWKDGRVQFGRPINKVPAANTSINAPSNRNMNTRSYAVCLEGNFQPDDAHYAGEKPSDEQIHSLITLLEMVKGKLPNLKWLIGHRDVAKWFDDPADATSCPGDLLYARLHEIRVATGLHTPPDLLPKLI